MGRKIAVVGASPAGFVQLASLVKHKLRHKKFAGDEYVLIHDPDKVYPFLLSPVGTALFGGVESEYTSLNLNRSFAHKHFAATDCHGAKFIGWGNNSNFNVNVSVKGGGLSGQANAIKLAISKALTNYDLKFRIPLKKEGLLTRDSRVVERKKYGRRKARRSFQFSKR